MIAFKIICLVFMVISGIGAIADNDFGRYGALFLISGLLYAIANAVEILSR